MKKSYVVLIIVVILAAIGGAIALTKNSDNNSTTNGYQAKSSPQKKTNSASGISKATTAGNTQTASAAITYSDSGFSPSTLTVKSGDKVVIKNTASDELQFNSDPHPSHTEDTELNIGSVSAGQEQSFTITMTGSFGYHNHLNPSEKGMIVVQ